MEDLVQPQLFSIFTPKRTKVAPKKMEEGHTLEHLEDMADVQLCEAVKKRKEAYMPLGAYLAQRMSRLNA